MLSNPPDDHIPSNFTTCSKWCHEKWSEAVERGDNRAADVYMQLLALWESRGQ